MAVPILQKKDYLFHDKTIQQMMDFFKMLSKKWSTVNLLKRLVIEKG